MRNELKIYRDRGRSLGAALIAFTVLGVMLYALAFGNGDVRLGHEQRIVVIVMVAAFTALLLAIAVRASIELACVGIPVFDLRDDAILYRRYGRVRPMPVRYADITGIGVERRPTRPKNAHFVAIEVRGTRMIMIRADNLSMPPAQIVHEISKRRTSDLGGG